MVGLNIKEVQGRFSKYLKVIAEDGYCFYDKSLEERNYLTDLTAPYGELENIKNNFVAVWGDADELNAKLEEEGQKAVEDDGSGI
ncbi:MAG: hypothetical protein IJ371_02850 [Clostridia bacterium]|nr:hypothetical protein [Clostridia bacterium]